MGEHSYKTCMYQTKIQYPEQIEILALNHKKTNKKEMAYECTQHG